MRTFIAIELSNDIRKELASLQNELKTADADVKWVKPENIHLTLKFLGEVKEESVEAIASALDKVGSGYTKFDISLFKVGAFPKLDHPRVIWVGIDNNCSVVEEIAVKIEDECEKLSFPREKRSFSAHLTLGRVRSPKNKTALKEKIMSLEVKPLTSQLRELTLFKSTLTPKGPIYSKLHVSNLA